MKTARTALLLVMTLVLVACTGTQQRSLMSMAANRLFWSLLDAQSGAPLTQSSFRASHVVATPENDAADGDSAAADQPEVASVTTPVAPLPLAPARLADIAAHAAGVAQRSCIFLRTAPQIAATNAKAAMIERCRYIRDEKGKRRVVVRAEITVPGSAIVIHGLDDFSL